MDTLFFLFFFFGNNTDIEVLKGLGLIKYLGRLHAVGILPEVALHDCIVSFQKCCFSLNYHQNYLYIVNLTYI